MIGFNFKQIDSLEDLPAVVRDLSKSLQRDGGVTVGTWLQKVSSADLLLMRHSMLDSFRAVNLAMERDPELKARVKKRAEQNSGSGPVSDIPPSRQEREQAWAKSPIAGNSMKVLPLTADLLAFGEGLDLSDSMQVAADRVMTLMTFIRFELLKRKGFNITIPYKQLTLQDVWVIQPGAFGPPEGFPIEVDEADKDSVFGGIDDDLYEMAMLKGGVDKRPDFYLGSLLRKGFGPKDEVKEEDEGDDQGEVDGPDSLNSLLSDVKGFNRDSWWQKASFWVRSKLNLLSEKERKVLLLERFIEDTMSLVGGKDMSNASIRIVKAPARNARPGSREPKGFD